MNSAAFVSYFLTLLHEEGNRFLPTSKPATATSHNATSHQTNKHTHNTATNNNTPRTGGVGGNFNRFNNTENVFNSPCSTAQTPKSACMATRKISLKPLNTPRSGGGGGGVNNSSPHDLFNQSGGGGGSGNRNNNNNNNNNYNRRSIQNFSPSPTCVSFPSRSNNNYNNNNNSSNSKLASKPTLFDYLATTPIKSPNHQQTTNGAVDNSVIVRDFKNRFQQHQQQLVQQHHRSQQQQQQQQQTPQPEQAASIDPAVEMSPLIDIERQRAAASLTAANGLMPKTTVTPVSATPSTSTATATTTTHPAVKTKEEHAMLGESVREALDSGEMQRLSTLADLYAQLILNNLVLTLNTELFFVFQLLTLSSAVEDTKATHRKMTCIFRIFDPAQLLHFD